MTYGELKRRLQRLGIRLHKERARHELWLNSATGLQALIPRHDQQEVPDGTLARILRDLGLRRQDL